ERLERDVLANDPRIVIVGLGGNDYLQSVPLAQTEENLRGIVRRLHDGGAMVVLLGFRFPSLNVDYEGMYERVAEDERCLLVPDVLDGILSKPSLRSDPIHPNASGYAILAERVAGPVAKLIETADAR
ncbi:MAG TPA: GDSL-type esterase/lipase family protein, partial [Thermoanaerobaculia bacterium]